LYANTQLQIFVSMGLIMRRVYCAAVAAAAAGFISTASAADLPTKVPAYMAPAAVYAPTWTGLYAGVIGGYATGRVHADPTGILPALGAYPVSFTADGGFAGGQLGYNYEFANRTVLGIVGDLAWADLKGSACTEVTPGRCTGDPRDSYGIGTIKWLASLRAKAGLAVGTNGLLYATGGAAFAGAKAEDTYIDGVNNVTATATHTGWTVGVGGEYKLTHNVSFGLEYLYADLGKKSYAFNSAGLGGGLAGTTMGVDASIKLNIFKAALNFYF
jgi:outer membrane immunogenic protein